MTESTLRPGVFAHAVTIPAAAMDGNGHVNNLEYLRWMQEIAMAHSDARGWDLARYGVAGSSWVTQPPATRVALEPVVTTGGGGGVTGLQLTPGCVMKSGTTVIHEITLLAAYPHTDAVHTASLQQFTATISGTGFSPVVVSTPAALLGPLNRVTPSPS